MTRNECLNKSAEIPGCIRRMTRLERLFLCALGCNVSIVARITWNVSEHELVRAMDAIRRMHPLVGAKIVFDAQYDAWFSTVKVSKG